MGKERGIEKQGTPLTEDFGALRHTGPGTIHVDRKVTVSGKGSVRLDTPASLGKKNPTNRNYATPEIIRPSTGKTCGNTTAFPFGYMWMHRAFI